MLKPSVGDNIFFILKNTSTKRPETYIPGRIERVHENSVDIDISGRGKKKVIKRSVKFSLLSEKNAKGEFNRGRDA